MPCHLPRCHLPRLGGAKLRLCKAETGLL
jgi:hypothetical protein